MVERTAVKSSNLASIGFDEDNNVLEVEFLNGSVYQYLDVPRWVYDDMMLAESSGKFFNTEIRPSYAFNRVG